MYFSTTYTSVMKQHLEVRHKGSTCWGEGQIKARWRMLYSRLMFTCPPFSQLSLNCWALSPGNRPYYLSLLGPLQPLTPLSSLREALPVCSWFWLFCLYCSPHPSVVQSRYKNYWLLIFQDKCMKQPSESYLFLWPYESQKQPVSDKFPNSKNVYISLPQHSG